MRAQFCVLRRGACHCGAFGMTSRKRLSSVNLDVCSLDVGSSFKVDYFLEREREKLSVDGEKKGGG